MGDVRVVCRVRPPNSMEIARGVAGVRCVKTQSPGLVQLYSDGIESGNAPQGFTFDSVFGEDSTQQQVFDEVARPVVADIMEGYNATIFAYGQTSSGKTFTMEGASIDDEALRGIIPRTATELFARLMEADENMEFVVKVSYIEIYMERIRDLLDPYKTKINLQVREDNDKGIYIDGVTELCVTSDDELLSTMRSGAANRAVAATGMNEGSSRSHSVFMVTLYQRNLETNSTKVALKLPCTGKLYLVDLAGSEMVRKTGASGKQLEEAKTINKSLSALGMVINALTTANVGFVPYRDSKLTRVLQEALGGNSRTSLIINVSPSIYNAPESMSTLRFGNRAKAIKNKAVVNAEKSAEEYKQLLAKADKTINMQQNYIVVLETRLKQQLPTVPAAPEAPTVPADSVASSSPSPEQEAATLAALQTLQERVVRLEEQLTEEQHESTRRGDEIRSLTAVLNDTQAAAANDQRTWERQRGDDQTARLLQEELANMKLEMDKVMFENQEIKLHVETLQQEQTRLLASDADSTAAARLSVGGGRGDEEDVDMTAATPPPTPPVTRVGSLLATGDESSAAKLEVELKAAQEELVQHQTQAQKDIQRFTEERRQLTSQIQDLALQLQTVQSNQQALLSTSGPTGMSARERQHMRSIQQKLEQLVAVHRQLLRKYASLEAEHNEARQKLGLRDDRIKSLEANTRLMASNMRLQSEKHLEELSALHVQLAELRKNLTLDLEDRVSIDGSLPAAGGIAASVPVRRQTSLYVRQNSMVGDGVIRPIRGGGRRQSTLDSPPKSSSIQVPDTSSAGGLGFLQRMLGLK
ncbi:hypothetical protein DYB34_000920 [Aphanomyces astaci]|uniref:Kinesin-like protein n=1 Tax=Aphanomyces astaci TaxID=112090 RepID=A0A397EU00_APHAT|nr:hypothetical protein DYB34_000920 [Aphanomyces astaci]RHZ06081.1 hypothetical protein DYB31_000701 [Aphanomyces astaci]